MADGLPRFGLGTLARAAVDTLRSAFRFFAEDRARRLGAGLAYYALFALIPSLLLSVGIAAAFVGREAAAGGLQEQLSSVFGANAAREIENAIATLWSNTDRSGFALFSFGVVLYSASVLFVAWRDSVELIWQVPYERGIHTTLKARAFAVLVPFCAGLLFAATLILQSLVTFVESVLDGLLLDVAIRTLSAVAQAVIGIAAIAALYRYSARSRRPNWWDILPASLMVVVVLSIGFWAYGLYLRFVGATSVTGAASSVVLGLVVIYYSAQVLLLGAEIIKVLRARRLPSDGGTAAGDAGAAA